MPDDTPQHDRRRAPREPDDVLTKRLERMQRDHDKAIRDMQERHIGEIRALENQVTAVQQTHVSAYEHVNGALTALRDTVTEKMTAIQQQIADHAAVIEAQKQQAERAKKQAELEAQDKHEQAIREQARSELLAEQQKDKDRALAKRQRDLVKHNRIILAIMVGDITAIFGLGVYLFTNADHSTPTNDALAISGLVMFILLAIVLAIRVDPEAGF